MLKWKQFVRESDIPDSEEKTDYALANQSLKGEEVRQFYEEIIHEPSERKRETPRRPICSKARQQVSQDASSSKDTDQSLARRVPKVPKTDNIWKAAETNDSLSLTMLVDSNVDINAKDSFGWTSLMCASCSGAEECVKILIKAGADTSVEDKAGYNALNLAKKNRHDEIIKLLQGLCSAKDEQMHSHPKLLSHYCEPCGKRFKTSQKKHEASTTHLLAVGGKNQRTFYGIPDSNKGFQLLMWHGWDREQGLGPDGTGRKFPIKTTQKHDRSGVGSVSKRKPTDREHRSEPRPYQTNSRRDRNFERNFRQEFS